MDIIIMIVFGCFAGLAAGLLGLGGGVIFVPVLAYVFLHQDIGGPFYYMHLAVGTSLAIMIFTSATSFMENRKKQRISRYAFKTTIPWVILFCTLGAVVASFLPSYVLSLFFALLLILMMFKLFRKIIQPSSKKKFADDVIADDIDIHIKSHSAVLNGVLIGLQGGMLGGGGGVITVPYLTHKGYPIKIATGTSSAITIPITIIGTITYIILGFFDHIHVAYAIGYIYWPALLCMAPTSMIFAKLGVKLSSHIPPKTLEIMLLLLMFALTIKMIDLVFAQ
jgi:uncharacterized membrane protein YfcA